MIESFRDKIAEDIFHGKSSRHARKLPVTLHEKARRLLDQLNTAPTIDFLKIPPGNRLEKLSGDYKGCWSIRINNQWRIVFRWKDDDAHDISIIDYH
jgi:proteic killer suppression protein